MCSLRLRRETPDDNLPFVLAHLGKVVGGLHREPCFGRAANRLPEAHRHLWRNGALIIDDLVKLLARHPETLGRLRDCEAKPV